MPLNQAAERAVDVSRRRADNAALGSWRALFAGPNLARSVVLAGGCAIHALSIRVVVTVLPSAVIEIGGLRFFAWTMTVAMVSGIWGAVSAAPLAVSRGFQGAYHIALALFVVGSITCAVSPSMAVFLAGRLLQGLGGGLLTALAYTTISRVFPAHLHTRAIAMLSGVWGVAALSGPLLGGALAGCGLWRWAFWIDVPLAAAVGVIARRTILTGVGTETSPPPGRSPIAFGRLVLLGGSVLAVAIGGVSGRASTSGFGMIVATILLVVMLRIDANPAHRVRHRRLMPRGALDPRAPVGTVTLVMALIGGCTMAAVYVPYVVIDVGKHAPITGGCLSAVIPVSWTAAALATASVRSVWAHRFILSGPALVTLGLILTGWALTTGSLALIALALAPIGAGIGVAWAYLGALLVEFAEAEERDVAAAFISTNNLLSQAFGAAFAGMIANIAGFGDPTLGSDGVLRAVLWLFVAVSLFPAAALPLAVRVVRLSARIHTISDECAGIRISQE
jgi:MFS family permease